MFGRYGSTGTIGTEFSRDPATGPAPTFSGGTHTRDRASIFHLARARTRLPAMKSMYNLSKIFPLLQTCCIIEMPLENWGLKKLSGSVDIAPIALGSNSPVGQWGNRDSRVRTNSPRGGADDVWLFRAELASGACGEMVKCANLRALVAYLYRDHQGSATGFGGWQAAWKRSDLPAPNEKSSCDEIRLDA